MVESSNPKPLQEEDFSQLFLSQDNLEDMDSADIEDIIARCEKEKSRRKSMRSQKEPEKTQKKPKMSELSAKDKLPASTFLKIGGDAKWLKDCKNKTLVAKPVNPPKGYAPIDVFFMNGWSLTTVQTWQTKVEHKVVLKKGDAAGNPEGETSHVFPIVVSFEAPPGDTFSASDFVHLKKEAGVRAERLSVMTETDKKRGSRMVESFSLSALEENKDNSSSSDTPANQEKA